jgi:malate synthase
MGGMAAQIPIKDDPDANAKAMEKVRADKLREVREGHDGTWVAHPALVAIAKQVFDEGMPKPNQLDRLREDVVAAAAALIAAPAGTRTETGLRHNIRVGIQYLEAWLGGQGAVPIYNLMEDAATAEISRTQIWQWIKHRASLEDGRTVTRPLVQQLIAEESSASLPAARALFEAVATSDELTDFLTLPAYEILVEMLDGKTHSAKALAERRPS